MKEILTEARTLDAVHTNKHKHTQGLILEVI